MKVVIVGGGFSGALTATGLLRDARLDVTIVERGEAPIGRGVAYATPDPRHLLNVPAERMGALPGRPGDFGAWAAGRGIEGRYLPRQIYGDYVEATLADAERAGPGRLRRVRDEAVRIAGGVVVTRSGRRLEADAIVLATGVSRPPVLAAIAAVADHPAYVGDPWDHAQIARLHSARRVLMIGTGLTTVDVALTLAGGPEIVAVSRHGLLPAPHAITDAPCPPAVVQPGECATADELAARVTAAATAGDWRAVVDGLRPVTQAIWRALPAAEQERFVREHSRRWETVRSRMAPAVADRIADLRARGALRVEAARIEHAEPQGERLAVTLGGRTLVVDAVINGTGPAWDPREGDSDLVRALLADGLAAPGPLGLGLRTEADGRLPGTAIYTLGALRRGELWESVAVPELREQAAAVAAAIRVAGASPLAVAI